MKILSFRSLPSGGCHRHEYRHRIENMPNAAASRRKRAKRSRLAIEIFQSYKRNGDEIFSLNISTIISQDADGHRHTPIYYQ